ncbi:ABC transporter permease [Aminipila sp.]|uniref:ABC transporter permease n=1 Tax=Aminipila sp. TaxID=2060095 RepID=UPI0028A14B41|nr:ABC transporter permease subunit [Aminipila sp.]
MRGFIAFIKKELIENTRNYRLLIMLAIFLIFGLMSPLLAKFTPQLMEALMPNLAEAFENPTALDSWTQFYKNVSSLGLSLTIILFSSCLSGEYAKGTLTIMLTKGLSRPAVVLSKFSAAAVILTVSYWLSFGVTYGYTDYLWPAASLPHVFFAAFALWIAGLLYLCILMLGCVLFRQAFTSILFLLVISVIMGLVEQIEQTAGYSPVILVSKNIDLLSGTVTASYFIIPLIVSVFMSAALLMMSIVVFNKKQL